MIKENDLKKKVSSTWTIENGYEGARPDSQPQPAPSAQAGLSQGEDSAPQPQKIYELPTEKPGQLPSVELGTVPPIGKKRKVANWGEISGPVDVSPAEGRASKYRQAVNVKEVPEYEGEVPAETFDAIKAMSNNHRQRVNVKEVPEYEGEVPAETFDAIKAMSNNPPRSADWWDSDEARDYYDNLPAEGDPKTADLTAGDMSGTATPRPEIRAEGSRRRNRTANQNLENQEKSSQASAGLSQGEATGASPGASALQEQSENQDNLVSLDSPAQDQYNPVPREDYNFSDDYLNTVYEYFKKQNPDDNQQWLDTYIEQAKKITKNNADLLWEYANARSDDEREEIMKELFPDGPGGYEIQKTSIGGKYIVVPVTQKSIKNRLENAKSPFAQQLREVAQNLPTADGQQGYKGYGYTPEELAGVSDIDTMLSLISDRIDGMNLPSPEERAREYKLYKTRRALAGISDGLMGLANLIMTTKGAPSANLTGAFISDKIRKEWLELMDKRQKEMKNWMDYMMNYTTLTQKRYETLSKRIEKDYEMRLKEARDKRDASLAEARLLLMASNIDKNEAMTQYTKLKTEIETVYGKAIKEAEHQKKLAEIDLAKEKKNTEKSVQEKNKKQGNAATSRASSYKRNVDDQIKNRNKPKSKSKGGVTITETTETDQFGGVKKRVTKTTKK